MKNLGCKQPFLCCILWNRSITKQIWVYVIPSSAEQMLLLTQNQLFQCLSFKTQTATWEAFTRVDGYTGCCHWTGDLFVFIWFPKALGQPDSLGWPGLLCDIQSSPQRWLLGSQLCILPTVSGSPQAGGDNN